MRLQARFSMSEALRVQGTAALAAIVTNLVPAIALLLLSIVGVTAAVAAWPAVRDPGIAPGSVRGVPLPTHPSMPVRSAAAIPTAKPRTSATPAPTATPLPPARVLRTYPIDGDADVPPDAPLRIVFDQPMDAHLETLQVVISPSVQLALEWAAPDTLVLRSAPRQPEVTYELAVRAARGQNGASLAAPLALSFRQGGNGVPIPILMFHELTELPADADETKREWSNSPADFHAQLAMLDGLGAHIVSLEQAVAYLSAGEPLPARPAVLTFDDGYTNAYRVAAPILAERHQSGTFFLSPEMLGYGAYLSWDEVKDLLAKGMTAGCHGLTHSAVNELWADEAEAEFGESRRILQEHTGAAIDLFSFPYGAYSEEAIAQVAAHGYRAAVSINPTVFQRRDELFHLGRIHVGYGQTEALREMLPWR